jgi:PAS domain S-box-containing protein
MPRRTAAEERQQQRDRHEAISRAIESISKALSVRPVDLRTVLQTVVEQARAVAGAQYAALGIVVDPNRSFEPWVYSGLPLEEAAAIGRYPRPVGLLGAVPREGKTIRLREVEKDPRFRGWPPHHPEMTSFMGVPINYRGSSVGNLYLTNKVGAEEFSDEDQWAVELLAAYAGVALQVARIDELRATVDAERARLQAILESAPNGILYVEAETGRLLANAAAAKLLGRTFDAQAGPAQLEGCCLRPDGRPLGPEEMPTSRALRGETLRAEEHLVKPPEGNPIPVLVSAGPVRGPAGDIIGAVAAFEDITPIRELEELREEWASLIAHDLRQPVTVITSYVDILRRLHEKPGVPEAEVKALEHIGAAVVSLNRMIGELLDVSRLEAGRVPMELQAVDLPDLVRAVVERSAGITAGHPVELRVQGEIPRVWVDPSRIEQVLANLLSNAAKYSFPESPIEVGLRGRDGDVLVSVSNQGRGIPPEEQPLIFSRFHRARAAEAARIPGLGLGLYISKALVEAHGGRIWVESVPDRTTTFYFTLPVRPTSSHGT